MQGLTDNQHFHLVLADIAMAAAVKSCDATTAVALDEATYVAGAGRDLWLEQNSDPALRQRVTALASAAVASLQSQPGEQLAATAQRYGVPLAVDLAERIAEHFTNKQNAVLTYNR